MSNVLTSLRTGIACCEKMIFMGHVVCNLTSINFKNPLNEYNFFFFLLPPPFFYFTDFKIVIVNCFRHASGISVNIMLCLLCLFLSYWNQIFWLFSAYFSLLSALSQTLSSSLSFFLSPVWCIYFSCTFYKDFNFLVFSPLQFFFCFILFLLSPVLLQSLLFFLPLKTPFHP